MSYAALPDHRIPYDIDGTVVYAKSNLGTSVDWSQGPGNVATSGDLAELNDSDYVDPAASDWGTYDGNSHYTGIWFFFPELREITGVTVGASNLGYPNVGNLTLEGSDDTTNGIDGTWAAATVGTGALHWANTDNWRARIKTVSFAGPVKAIRMAYNADPFRPHLIHLFGEKAGGQTPDDLVFVDPDDSNNEFPTALDTGDRQLGTSIVDHWAIKNTSATKTCNTISLQCNDADYVISTDNVNWVATINVTSLAPGAQSATYYLRCTTPNPGGALGPHAARIVATWASWT